MTKKDFLRVADYTKEEIKEIFDLVLIYSYFFMLIPL